MAQIYRRRGVEKPCLVVVQLDCIFCGGAVRSQFKNGMNSRNRQRNITHHIAGQEWTPSNKKESQIVGGEIESDAEISEGGNGMGRVGAGVIDRGNGEISDEYLVNEGGILRERGIAEGERRLRRSDEIGMNVFRLIAIFEGEILEE